MWGTPSWVVESNNWFWFCYCIVSIYSTALNMLDWLVVRGIKGLESLYILEISIFIVCKPFKFLVEKIQWFWSMKVESKSMEYVI